METLVLQGIGALIATILVWQVLWVPLAKEMRKTRLALKIGKLEQQAAELRSGLDSARNDFLLGKVERQLSDLYQEWTENYAEESV